MSGRSGPLISRRHLLQAGVVAGAGLSLGFCVRGERHATPSSDAPFAPNAWIRVERDGTVLLLLGQSEMGQGVVTSLPLILAEEMDADWSTVRVEQAPAHPAYEQPGWGRQRTTGSASVRNFWRPLREAGAAARMMLVAAAAARWGVPAAKCRAERSAVVHDGSGRRLTFGDLAEEAGRLALPRRVRLKDPAEFRLIGTDPPRPEFAEIVTGRPVFASDVRRPGQVTAVVLRPPRLGARVATVEADAAQRMPGVVLVRQVATGVAVVARDLWTARRAGELVRITWDESKASNADSVAILKQLSAAAELSGTAVRRDGNVSEALARAARRHQATYEAPFLAHATMEPMTCTALVEDGRCTVWAPTQDQTGARAAAVRGAGVAPDLVTVLTPRLGGGFGRRAQSDFVQEAAEVAAALPGVPVQVIWTREDDLRHDFYRPVTVHRLEAGLDARERVVGWRHHVAGASAEGARELPYSIPSVLVAESRMEFGVPTGIWRAVDHSQNAFAVESFIDELAALAAADPVDYRLGLLSAAPREAAALRVVAAAAGWGTSLPPGYGRGVALHAMAGSIAALVAEVSADTDGRIRANRMVCAVDCGVAVHPDGIRAQVEGAVTMGLSATLRERITVAGGQVRESNFHDYPILGFAEAPTVEVHILPGTGDPGGIGEVGLPPVAPAVANAVYAATGQRLRSLPLGRVDGRGLRQTGGQAT
ncbi:MAG TPA: molybdopterin cofactor-binding domain-containing protein [Gemmatimonadales bacterium]|nr:molybdopterin cofactor-binding domain-containing protein [Gemmatimonadales bacterium]